MSLEEFIVELHIHLEGFIRLVAELEDELGLQVFSIHRNRKKEKP